MINSILFHLVLIIDLINYSRAFPSGATADACSNLIPRHPGTYSSFERSPYFVVASGDRYDSADIFSHKPKSIKVDISGAPFKGFVVTAVDPHSGKRIGSFNAVKGTTTLPCAAITHTDNRLKKYASLLWVPPKDEKGFVTFVATVVQSYSHYYPGIMATVLEKPEYPTDNHYSINMDHTIPDPLSR